MLEILLENNLPSIIRTNNKCLNHLRNASKYIDIEHAEFIPITFDEFQCGDKTVLGLYVPPDSSKISSMLLSIFTDNYSSTIDFGFNNFMTHLLVFPPKEHTNEYFFYKVIPHNETAELKRKTRAIQNYPETPIYGPEKYRMIKNNLHPKQACLELANSILDRLSEESTPRPLIDKLIELRKRILNTEEYIFELDWYPKLKDIEEILEDRGLFK